nr:MAG TPA: hypothetical protein [Caudoviricetes sp.]
MRDPGLTSDRHLFTRYIPNMTFERRSEYAERSKNDR